jgi:hypothetical protein
MKPIITALLVILLTPAILFGAEANVKSSFTVKAPYQKTIDFIDNNPKKMRDAAGLEVLQDMGDGKLKVNYPAAKDGGASAPTNCSALAESYVRASGSNVSLGRSDRA